MYMNYLIPRNLKAFVTMMLFATLLASCVGNGKASKDEMSRNDSTIIALYEKGEYDRVKAVMDSMEQLGVIPVWSVASIRAGIHALTDRDMGMIDKILKEALTHQDMKTDLDSLRYTECMVKYGYILLGQNKMEEILRMLTPTTEQMKQKVKHPEYGNSYMASLLKCYDQLMCTQFYLGMKEEMKHTCEELYQGHMERIKQDSSIAAKFQFACDLDHIAEVLNTNKDYATAEKYVRCLDSLCIDLERRPETNEAYKDELKAMRSMARSKYELGIGNRVEADKAFAEFLKTDYSKKGVAPFNIAGYLLQAGRYDEAADKYALLDRYLSNVGADFDFNFAPQFCEKFKANYLAGRRDSALAVAKRVFDCLDSLITADRQSNAIEMATVYETQKKDAEIAKQQIALTQQRVIGLIIAIILLTVFFIIYTLIRKRAAKKLADMKAAQERIESELRIARDIQMSMVPHEFPQREGLDMFASMTPAKEVGGDLYGYEIIGDKLYFCVGDVSGKGVPASLFMAQVTRLFQTMARQGLMPADICSQMNDALSGKDNEEGMFVTFWLGLLDIQRPGNLSAWAIQSNLPPSTTTPPTVTP